MKRIARHLPGGIKQIAKRVARSVFGSTQYDMDWLRHPPENLVRLRCGIIGYGVAGSHHAHVLKDHPYFSLAGINSRTSAKRSAAEELGGQWFDTPEQMLTSDEVDVVVIATPHWQHAELAIAALRAGKHVICEKPLSATLVHSDAILRAVKEVGKYFDVVFHGRLDPVYMRAKAVLDSGELGPVQRCEMSESYWRSDAYFQTSSWKATWKGEGGGVLLNQGAHLLDRYVWFCGMPEHVSAFCDTAVHPIEVEDFVSGIFRHADGVHGLIHMNTTENPALARTLISCDRGRLSILNGVLRIERLHESSRAYTASAGLEAIELPPSTKEYSARPPVWTRRALSLFYENFAFAVAGKASFLVPVEDAAGSLELANAMLLSCDHGRALKLPLDRQEYEAFIFRMQAGSAPTFGLPPA